DDLTNEASDDETVTVATDTMTHNIQGHEHLLIDKCDDDLRLPVPPQTTVVVDHVDGDARVDGLSALEIGGVGGDLELRTIGRNCAVRSVDGDMRAIDAVERKLGTVGGDLHLERIAGGLAPERGA